MPSLGPNTIIHVPLGTPLSGCKRTKQELAYIPRNQRSEQDNQDEAALKRQDPFLFYSDERRRMELVCRPKQRTTYNEAPSSGLVERKSCISFEVSDALIMESMFDDLSMSDDSFSDGLDLDNEDEEVLFEALLVGNVALAKEVIASQQGSPQAKSSPSDAGLVRTNKRDLSRERTGVSNKRKDLRRSGISQRIARRGGRF